MAIGKNIAAVYKNNTAIYEKNTTVYKNSTAIWKIFTAICVCLLAGTVFSGCGNGDALRPKSGGKPFEVLVVGDISGIVRAALSAPTDGLPQAEPLFDVSTTPQLDPVSRVARAIVSVEVDQKAYQSVLLRYEYDRYAAPQFIVHVLTPSQEALKAFLEKDSRLLTDLLLNQEISNEQKSLRKKHNAEAAKSICQMFGVEMLVPQDLTAIKRGKDFLWVSDDGRSGNRSICVYTTPKFEEATSRSDAPCPLPTFAHLRDSVMQVNIPGERKGMYMQTVAPLKWQALAIGAADWKVARGLWEMRGGAMGGPMAAYVIDKGRYCLVIEAFVYAPGAKKRNRLRLLEAAIRTALSPQK